MTRTTLALSCFFLAPLFPSATAHGIEPNFVRYLASACANCHGTRGASRPGMPSLAGKPREAIARDMRDFASGRRPSTVMHQIAKGYSEEQIEALAAYFAAQARR